MKFKYYIQRYQLFYTNQQRDSGMISTIEPDWSRERIQRFWEPDRKLLASIRFYQKNKSNKTIAALILRKVAVLRHMFWSLITGADIPLNTHIGGGLLIPHPNGIVIHPEAIIGPNCLIFQQVTVGTRNDEHPPIIGGHVDIGAGAKILGNIKIGNNVRIGANAVVIDDINDGCTAVGIPARVIRTAI